MPTPATFTLTVADFVRLQKVVGRRFKQKLGFFSFQFFLRVLVWLCIGLAVATYARMMREYPEIEGPLQIVAALLVVAFLAIVAMPQVAQFALRKHMLAPNGAFLSPQSVEFSALGVSVRSATGNTVVPWAGIIARDEDDANYYLFIDAIQALVLPRSAIAPYIGEFEQYAYSGPKAPAIPIQNRQCFRFKSATHSDSKPPPFPIGFRHL